ncbi:MAG TPA: hypothetical protein VG939_18555, partial [Caulobacteraceae bacterium]|nr:hypothetical protein [Caulobacteraceae bacterium]
MLSPDAAPKAPSPDKAAANLFWASSRNLPIRLTVAAGMVVAALPVMPVGQAVVWICAVCALSVVE